MYCHFSEKQFIAHFLKVSQGSNQYPIYYACLGEILLYIQFWWAPMGKKVAPYNVSDKQILTPFFVFQ